MGDSQYVCKYEACNETLPQHVRYCPACGSDVGFPNVRMAEKHCEVQALELRVAKARQSAAAANYSASLENFGEAIKRSSAVIGRPLRKIIDLVEDPNRPYTSFHNELNSGARIPEDNIFDKTRTQFENALFPNFYKDILFAALTLDGRWHEWFGKHALILKDQMISHRATVFEENPFVFANRHSIKLTENFPEGYRCTWERRGELAIAKLYQKLDKSTKFEEYANVILPDDGENAEKDYIEVHIFGSFNRNAIQKIAGPVPLAREDRVFWKKLKKLAFDAGIEVDEY